MPSNRTFPSVGLSNPAIKLRRVVLPEPDGPIIAIKLPDFAIKSIDCRGCIESSPASNIFDNDWVSNKGVSAFMIKYKPLNLKISLNINLAYTTTRLIITI